MDNPWRNEAEPGQTISATDWYQVRDMIHSFSQISAASPICLEKTPTGGVHFYLSDLTTTSSGGYDTIQDEGSSLTQRTILNFIGPYVAAVDNGGSTRTDVTVGYALSAKAASFTASATVATVYQVSVAAGDVVCTLPLANTAPNGQTVTVRMTANATASANKITFAASGGDTIDTPVAILYLVGDVVTYMSDGVNKWILMVDGRKEHSCIVGKNAAQNIANATPTLVTWDASAPATFYNPASLFAIASPTRITIKRAGVYAVTAATEWFFANAVGLRQLAITHTNVINVLVFTITNIVPAVAGGGDTQQQVTGLFNAAVGDYFTITATQSSGGNLSLATGNSRFSLNWMGN